MSQQTAVEWLEELYYKSAGNLYGDDFKKARAMEKEQINKACYDGYYQEEWYDVRNYYDETYNKVNEDLGPEYDSAGFTEDDRIVNGQYRVIEK